MKNLFLLCLAIAASLGKPALAQGTFRNLDFESANIVFAQPASIATSNAVPGWSAQAGATVLDVIPYNVVSYLPAVGLYSPGKEGQFSVLLWGNGSLSQSGQLPADAMSLRFKCWSLFRTPTVTLNGQALPYLPLSAGADYVQYSADISAFAGQSALLTFSAQPLARYFLDAVEFSPTPTPEPSAPLLLGLAACVLVRRRQG